MSHADRYLLFNQTKQAKSASGDLSLTSFIKIAWIFLPFTIKKRSHMKHERTEGQQTQFIKEKSNVNAQATTLITTLVNNLSLVTSQVII